MPLDQTEQRRFQSALELSECRGCIGATENAGVENAIRQQSKGGKCRSRLAVWKAEPILYSDTALNYFFKIVFRLLSE